MPAPPSGPITGRIEVIVDDSPRAFRIDRRGHFFGEPDHAIRQSLATQAIARVERGRGGRTLAFKVTLEDGTVGYYKPEQTFSGSHWYAEIASYYLDRELGLGRVAPVVGRRLPWTRLRPEAGSDPRVPEVLVSEDGTVRGAFIMWVPGGLEPLELGRDWERWLRFEPLGLTPYQRPSVYASLASNGGAETNYFDGLEENPYEDEDLSETTPARRRLATDPDTPERPAELSDLILFDYLTHNVDRWGGNFTNVRTRGERGPLMFFDNGAAFTPGRARIPLMDSRLFSCQRFRRSTIDAVTALDLARLRRRMSADPLAPILTDSQLDALEARRQTLIEHVETMRSRFGDPIWF